MNGMSDETLQALNKALATVAVLVVLAIAGVTAVFYVRHKGKIEPTYRRAQSVPQSGNNSKTQEDAFIDMGQIRVFSKKAEGEESSPLVVVSPWFSYPEGDKQLYEELSSKEKQIKAVVAGYFAALTMDETRCKGEAHVKEELLEIINSNLVMGKIRAVYFNDYIFID